MYLNKNLCEVNNGKCSIFLSDGFNGFSFGQSLNPIVIDIRQYSVISKKCGQLFGTDEFEKFENSDEYVLVFSQEVKDYLGIKMLAIAPNDCYLYTSKADKEKSEIAEKKLCEKIGLQYDDKKTDSSTKHTEIKTFFNDYLNKAARGDELIVLNDGVDSIRKGNVLLLYPVNPVILTIEEYKDLSTRCDKIFGNDTFKTFENSNTSSIVFYGEIRNYLGHSALSIGFKKWFETISEGEKKEFEERKKRESLRKKKMKH